ncbi:hypothetical protein [Olsenella sp. Marseille-P4559]|uniref:hypothetical protein n=1 Tax=Olsenella sp. Marseille-P4559 TaxID=2364795 RepID=UPI0010303AD0|nr:hypothetical protein [Olsenella sp. Marseille-P4559]
MEEKLLKLAGGALVVFVCMAVAFQVAEQLGTLARAIVCTAGVVTMIGLPAVALHLFFGAGSRLAPGTWGGLAALVLTFAIPLVMYGMEGRLQGDAAAAIVLLPGFVAFFACLRGVASGE